MKPLKLIRNLAVLMILSIAVTIAGCNSRIEIPVKVKSTIIEGDMTDFFQVVDGTYSLIKEKGSNCFRVKVQLKRTDKPFNFSYDIEDVASRGFCELKCDLLDETGNPTFLAENVYGSEGFDENNIIKLDPGASGWLEFSYCSNMDAIKRTKLISFRAFIEKGGIPEKSSPSSIGDSAEKNDENVSDKGNSSKGNENWNSVLDSYEKYVNQYISLLKKANAGDLSAVTEYGTMLEKATEFADKLENASDDLSPEQVTRFSKLQAKLTAAATNL
jgi:hypothetical protein